MLFGQPIRQIAYYVKDIRQAVERHHKLFGSGPFFLLEDLRLTVNYRGRDLEIGHSAAFGQWGDVQVELMQWFTGPPSVIHDLYPQGSGRYGLHHVAVIADDLDAAIADMASAGLHEAMRSSLPAWDMTVVMIDAIDTYGHFIEIYQSVPSLVEFYDMVERAAEDFQGDHLLREMTL